MERAGRDHCGDRGLLRPARGRIGAFWRGQQHDNSHDRIVGVDFCRGAYRFRVGGGCLCGANPAASSHAGHHHAEHVRRAELLHIARDPILHPGSGGHERGRNHSADRGPRLSSGGAFPQRAGAGEHRDQRHVGRRFRIVNGRCLGHCKTAGPADGKAWLSSRIQLRVDGCSLDTGQPDPARAGADHLCRPRVGFGGGAFRRHHRAGIDGCGGAVVGGLADLGPARLWRPR